MNITGKVTDKIENSSVAADDPRRYLLRVAGYVGNTSVEIAMWGADAQALWSLDPNAQVTITVAFPS